jgi:hypothetical protein
LADSLITLKEGERSFYEIEAAQQGWTLHETKLHHYRIAGPQDLFGTIQSRDMDRCSGLPVACSSIDSKVS